MRFWLEREGGDVKEFTSRHKDFNKALRDIYDMTRGTENAGFFFVRESEEHRRWAWERMAVIVNTDEGEMCCVPVRFKHNPEDEE